MRELEISHGRLDADYSNAVVNFCKSDGLHRSQTGVTNYGNLMNPGLQAVIRTPGLRAFLSSR
jgi:hypothetical protein